LSNLRNNVDNTYIFWFLVDGLWSDFDHLLQSVCGPKSNKFKEPPGIRYSFYFTKSIIFLAFYFTRYTFSRIFRAIQPVTYHVGIVELCRYLIILPFTFPKIKVAEWYGKMRDSANLTPLMEQKSKIEYKSLS